MTTAKITTDVPTQDVSWRLASRLLQNIKRGSLTVIYQGDRRHFGITGALPEATVVVRNKRIFRDMMTGGSMSAAEGYIAGDWDSDNLTAVVELFAANIGAEEGPKWMRAPLAALQKIAHWLNRNTISGSKRNIVAHYDLGNDLFSSFLDGSMMYSSAIYPYADASLEQAQQYRLHRICEKLQLSEHNHLLEIGTGWGSLAIYAAEKFGCRVTTTTISEEQHAYAAEQIKAKGLEHRITLLKQDYRTLTGTYDRLVSIEMIEAVGHEFLPGYFQKIDELLTDEGVALLQSITIPEQRYDTYRKSVDFIRKYIFPGGHLPSLAVIAKHIGARTNMTISNVEDLTAHYADTLRDWHQRFIANYGSLDQQKYDEAFFRLWRYYFAYCEGGFRQRAIGTSQILFCKPGAQLKWQPL